METLISEIILLKKLVNELQKDFIEILKVKNTDKQVIKKKYAEAISKIKSKPKRVPKTTVKMKDTNKKIPWNYLQII